MTSLPSIRALAAGGFGSLLAVSFFATMGEAQPGSVKEIVKGVWFREGEIKEHGHCNNAIIEMKDYLIVIDANFPSGAKLALADAKKVSPKPVKYVFDTHHHGDHAYANAFWTRNGAVTIGHQGVADEMAAREPERWRQAAKTRKDVAELNLKTAEPPQKTFTQSPFVLEDSTRRVEFHHFGWAHTKGDGFAYLPKEKVLCTGDAATNGAYNFTGDGNVGNWPEVMRKALKLDIRHVLPGHGPAGGKEILEGEMAFMMELSAAVEREIKAGRKLSDLVTMKDGQPVATTVKLSGKVQNWVGTPLPSQVRDVYLEKTQGKPRGDIKL
jgi:glyoxylase-like metal-dependent hydrolase (beta-lactamase superfamily II)